MKSVLIVDDDRAFARSIQLQFELAKFEANTANTMREAIDFCQQKCPDYMILDLRLREADGLEIMAELRRIDIEIPTIMVTGEQDAKANIEAVKIGVLEYIRKPFPFQALLTRIKGYESERRTNVQKIVPVQKATTNATEIIGRSAAIQDILKQIGLLARSQVNVLILGESGTGKEMVARALHEATTPEAPFVPVNCTAMVANLLESELFGYKKGAFTGAGQDKNGFFELAAHGTLFLDEVGDLPIELQPKLLRVIQEREFIPVGGRTPVPFNARLIAATHRNLEDMVAQGTFREDLYYRLSVTNLVLPPLRDRKEDIEHLVHHLLTRISIELHRNVGGLTIDAMNYLQSYSWPGNIRELANVLTRAVALAQNETLNAIDFGILNAPKKDHIGSFSSILPLQEVERQYLQVALDLASWNITKAAEQLRISRTTLRKKIGEYGLARDAQQQS
ncbi:hypothetical protein BVY04_03675 [bacterium M21]|nr:hypothetical protein BVY04_03675 [bacterium M21]